MTPASDTEAIVVCAMLAPWRLHQFATRPTDAVKAECRGGHGWAGGGWIANATGKGISYEFSPGYGMEPTVSGLITWKRITELVKAAVTPELVAALGEALDRKGALDFLHVQHMWARQVEGRGPSPIADRDAHEQESHRLHWLINDLGEEIRDRIRNPYPLGQLDLFDLIGQTA